MTDKLTIDEKIDQMMVDLASVKTDVKWLKTLYLVILVPIFAVGGAAVATGVI